MVNYKYNDTKRICIQLYYVVGGRFVLYGSGLNCMERLAFAFQTNQTKPNRSTLLYFLFYSTLLSTNQLTLPSTQTVSSHHRTRLYTLYSFLPLPPSIMSDGDSSSLQTSLSWGQKFGKFVRNN